MPLCSGGTIEKIGVGSSAATEKRPRSNDVAWARRPCAHKVPSPRARNASRRVKLLINSDTLPPALQCEFDGSNTPHADSIEDWPGTLPRPRKKVEKRPNHLSLHFAGCPSIERGSVQRALPPPN